MEREHAQCARSRYWSPRQHEKRRCREKAGYDMRDRRGVVRETCSVGVQTATMHFRSASSSFSLKRQTFTSLIRNAINTIWLIWLIIIYFEEKNVPNKKMKFLFRWNKSGFSVRNTILCNFFYRWCSSVIISLRFTARSQDFILARAFITYRALAIAKRKTKRRRRSYSE